MKKIYINEDKLRLIADSIDKKDEEVTFEKFLTKIKEHLSNVLDNAMSTDVDGFFTDHGLSRELLMNKLLDRGILKKTENFTYIVSTLKETTKNIFTYMKMTT